jgi:hypothetical protein
VLGGLAGLAALAGSARPLGARSSAAAPRGPRYWINLIVSGGMDAISTFDPRTAAAVAPRIDVPYAPREIVSTGTEIGLAPAMRALAPWASRFSVINGVLVNTANHPTGQAQAVRLRTGATPASLAAFEVLAEARRTTPLGHVVLNALFDTSRTPDYFGEASSKNPMGGPEGIFTALDRASPDELRELALVVRRQARVAGAELAPAATRTADLLARVAEIPRLELRPWVDDPTELGLAEACQRALWLIEHDLCVAVTLGPRFAAWDSHNDNASIQGRLGAYLAAVLARLFAALDERRNAHGRLSAQTGVIVASEIGRLPYLNAMRGKDHFPQVPLLIAGPGLVGGRAFGATGHELEAAPTSLRTGRADARGRMLRLDDIGTTVLALAGIDPRLAGFAGDRLRFLDAT